MRGQSSRRGVVGLAVIASALIAWLIIGSPLIASAARGRGAAAVHKLHSGKSITVIEHAVTDTVVQSGGKGDKTGNLLTFHNNVFDPTDTKQVGTDLGTCTRIAPADGSWTCSWTTFLAHGQIVVEGPYYDAKNSVLAITGGTGSYARARGQMALVARNGGKEYAFEFHLS